jgi:hypothetical protein
MADKQVTVALRDSCTCAECILPSESVVEVIVCEDGACLLHPENINAGIASRNKGRMRVYLRS